ncbi:translation initiation factor eIF5A, partial [Coemansia sp. RSA 2610]
MADEHEHEHNFEQADSGASKTFPMQCSALRKGGHVVIKGRPCKIIDMSTSKTGKHGHAKVNLVAIDIFTNKKYEDLSPSTHNMDVPHVKREEFPLVYVDGEFNKNEPAENAPFLSLMLPSGETKDDIQLPANELGEKLYEEYDE